MSHHVSSRHHVHVHPLTLTEVVHVLVPTDPRHVGERLLRRERQRRDRPRVQSAVIMCPLAASLPGAHHQTNSLFVTSTFESRLPRQRRLCTVRYVVGEPHGIDMSCSPRKSPVGRLEFVVCNRQSNRGTRISRETLRNCVPAAPGTVPGVGVGVLFPPPVAVVPSGPSNGVDDQIGRGAIPRPILQTHRTIRSREPNQRHVRTLSVRPRIDRGRVRQRLITRPHRDVTISTRIGHRDRQHSTVRCCRHSTRPQRST